MFNALKYFKFWFAVSGIFVLFGILSLSFYGLKLGIDFKGGTMSEIKFKSEFDLQKVKSVLDKQGISGYQLQTSDNFGLIIRTPSIEKEVYDKLSAQIRTEVGDFQEDKFESIGPTVGRELAKNALIQLILVSLGIVIYIAYAFRNVPKPITSFRFGISAIIALLHDLLFVLGTFSLLGKFYNVEIDSLFVTAMLTVLGFSVHDTIVVFDRIRENLKTHASYGIEHVVNISISQTIVRSLNTSLTVLFVLLALLLFGGETIRYFVLALFVGVLAGTYSSIFIASPVLILWQKWAQKK